MEPGLRCSITLDWGARPWSRCMDMHRSRMAEKDCIGQTLPSTTVHVEKGLLRLFAKVTGETDPVYLDEQAAQDAGHRSLPLPPTYLFCLEMHGQSDPAA